MPRLQATTAEWSADRRAARATTSAPPFTPLASSRAVSKRRCPAVASRSAVAKPRPRLAPVTRMVRGEAATLVRRELDAMGILGGVAVLQVGLISFARYPIARNREQLAPP